MTAPGPARGGARRPSLSEHVRASLSERIASGALAPGDRLPTEQALIQEFGVSRTVVREAISGLRADGLVTSRQGAGVFVNRPAPGPTRRETLATLSAVIETLEVRTAIEVEAARLAALRASPAQLAKIDESWEEIERRSQDTDEAEAADLAFHMAIASATNNARFVEFFDFLGPTTIPRAQLRPLRATPDADTGYVAQLQREHRLIRDAISARDPDGAGRAMRDHLATSQDRYIALMRETRRV